MRVNSTKRDKDIVNFLNHGFVVTTEQMNTLFFNTQMSYRRRLPKLAKVKRVNRYRLDGNHSYIYYTGDRPKDYRKRIFLTRIFVKLLDIETHWIEKYIVNQKILFFHCDLYLILKSKKTHEKTLILLDGGLRGQFDEVPYKRLLDHHFEEFRQTILIPEGINDFIIVGCFPKKTPTNFNYLHLPSHHIEEHLETLFKLLN